VIMAVHTFLNYQTTTNCEMIFLSLPVNRIRIMRTKFRRINFSVLLQNKTVYLLEGERVEADNNVGEDRSHTFLKTYQLIWRHAHDHIKSRNIFPRLSLEFAI